MADEGTDSTQAPTEVVENSSNPELEKARAELKIAQDANRAQRETHDLHNRQYREQIQSLQNYTKVLMTQIASIIQIQSI